MKESKWRGQERSDKTERIHMMRSRKKWQKWRNINEGIKKEGIELKESKWRDLVRKEKNKGIKMKGSIKKG